MLGGNIIERSGGAQGAVSTGQLPDVVTPGTTTAPGSVQYDSKGRVIAVYEVWNAAVTYRNLDIVVSADDCYLYQSIVAGNLNHDPSTDDGTHWKKVSIPNVGTVNGQVPIWNSTSERFEPGTIPTGSGMPVGTDGQIAIHNATDWVAVTVSGDLTAANTGAFTVVKSHGNVFPAGAAVKGDLWYASAANTLAALAGNTTTTKKFLSQEGTGAASAAPVWSTLAAADLPFLFVDNEVPSGTKDGVNTDFTLAHTPVTGSVHLYLNGVRQAPTDDYTISAATITFLSAPVSTDTILADYRW